MKPAKYIILLLLSFLSLISCEKKDTSWSVTIYGNVVEEIGSPISSVQVSVTGFYHKGNGMNSTSGNISGASMITGTDGTYEIIVTMPVGATDSELKIIAEKKGYYSAHNTIYVTPDSEKRIQQSFTLKK